MKLPVAWYGWTDDAEDPDFVVEAVLPPTNLVRVCPRWPLALALRVADKRLSVEHRSFDGALPRMRVTLGMTMVYRLFGRSLDKLWVHLVEFEVLDAESFQSS